MSPKRAKKIRVGIYCTQIWPSDHDIGVISGQCLDTADIKTVDTASDSLSGTQWIPAYRTPSALF